MNKAKFVKGVATALVTMIMGAAMAPAHALDGFLSGQVGGIVVVGPGAGAPGAYDFRVSLAGNPVICNGQTFAYLQSTFANYSTLVANILTARSTGTSITIVWTHDNSGYCMIDYITW